MAHSVLAAELQAVEASWAADRASLCDELNRIRSLHEAERARLEAAVERDRFEAHSSEVSRLLPAALAQNLKYLAWSAGWAAVHARSGHERGCGNAEASVASSHHVICPGVLGAAVARYGRRQASQHGARSRP